MASGRDINLVLPRLFTYLPSSQVQKSLLCETTNTIQSHFVTPSTVHDPLWYFVTFLVIFASRAL